jgi:molybdopterin biosynthesis enzyme
MVNEQKVATPLRHQGSHMFTSIICADGYIEVHGVSPGLSKGDEVEVFKL